MDTFIEIEMSDPVQYDYEQRKQVLDDIKNQGLTKEEYEEAQNKMPKEIDWNLFQKYENKKNYIDNVDTPVCVGAGCEL